MENSNSEESFTLHVRLANGTVIELEGQNATASIGAVKTSLSERTEVPVARMRLMLGSTILADNQSLDSYGIDGSRVLRLVQLAGSHAQNPPRNLNGISSASAPALSPQQMMSNQARQLLMSNPQLAQSMMMAHPQMREAMENNPELRQFITDPELMRQNMNAMQNPTLLQEMQRNNDRALSNLESAPGGYAHIRRMYRTVQEPLTRAAEDSTRAPLDELNRRRARALGVTKPDASMINTSPLPNPWVRRRPPQQQRGSTADRMRENIERLSQMTFYATDHAPEMRDGGGWDDWMEERGHAGARGIRGRPVPNPFAIALQQQGQQEQQGRQGTSGSQAAPATAPADDTRSSTDAADVDANALSESERTTFQERYRDELDQLEEMGFPDKEKNLRALITTNGDLGLALNIIADADDE